MAYQAGDDIVLNYGGVDWAYLTGGMAGAFEHFSFADGPALSWLQLIGRTYGGVVHTATAAANATLAGGKLDDSLSGTGGGSTFSGGRGDDGRTERDSLRRWSRGVARRTARRPNAYNIRRIVRMKRAT